MKKAGPLNFWKSFFFLEKGLVKMEIKQKSLSSSYVCTSIIRSSNQNTDSLILETRVLLSHFFISKVVCSLLQEPVHSCLPRDQGCEWIPITLLRAETVLNELHLDSRISK